MAAIARSAESILKGIAGDPSAERKKEKAIADQQIEQQRLLDEKAKVEDAAKAEDARKQELAAAKKLKTGKKSTGRRGTILTGENAYSSENKTILGS